MTKSTLSKMIDGFIMAPHKVMNSTGDDPSASWVHNLIHQPSVKTIGLLTATFSLAGDSSNMQSALIGGLTGMVAYQGLRAVYNNLNKPKAVYYDTDPKNVLRRTDGGLKFVFELAYNNIQKKNFKVAMVAGAIAVDATAFPAYTGAFMIMAGATGLLTDAVADQWRMRQVLKDEWVATNSPPPKFKHVKRGKLLEMQPEMQLQPIPVRTR